MMTLLTIVLAILASFAALAVLYALARFVGLGRCMACRRACPPWAAYCWTHSPDVHVGAAEQRPRRVHRPVHGRGRAAAAAGQKDA